jgi:hypothetical protein
VTLKREVVTVAATCDCADCRQFRVWRAEGTDEWQPDADEWTARSMSTAPNGIDVDAIQDPGAGEAPY